MRVSAAGAGGRCQHRGQGVSSPGECARVRGGGGKEETGQRDRQTLPRANTHAVGGCMDGWMDGWTDR